GASKLTSTSVAPSGTVARKKASRPSSITSNTSSPRLLSRSRLDRAYSLGGICHGRCRYVEQNFVTDGFGSIGYGHAIVTSRATSRFFSTAAMVALVLLSAC